MLHYAFDIIRVYSEILFSERLCRIETSHLICDANWLPGFCMGRYHTGKCYRTDHYSFLLTCLFLFFVMYMFFFSGKLEIRKITV